MVGAGVAVGLAVGFGVAVGAVVGTGVTVGLAVGSGVAVGSVVGAGVGSGFVVGFGVTVGSGLVFSVPATMMKLTCTAEVVLALAAISTVRVPFSSALRPVKTRVSPLPVQLVL